MTEPRTPHVFIASTHEDLRPHREAVARAVRKLRFVAIESSDWPSRGSPPLETCLKEVDGADVVVVVVAHRHGWTPPCQKEGEFKSITRLECEHADKRPMEVIPFLVDPDVAWDRTQTEAYRIEAAAPDDMAQVAQEVARDMASLREFKAWLGSFATHPTFREVADLELRVYQALSEWGKTHSPAVSAGIAAADVREQYLAWLRRTCESVELLGLDPKDSQSVRLGHVYVPAVTASPSLERGDRSAEDVIRERERRDLLLHRLGESSLYVPGAPGAGKSTFCRWVALSVANGACAPHAVAPPDDFTESLPDSLAGKLPVLVELRRLATHEEFLKGKGRWSRAELEGALGGWIDAAKPHPLTQTVFRDVLHRGECLLILDGVDEMPEALGSHRPRLNLVTGLADALPDWEKAGNRVLVTSRPYGLNAKEQSSLRLPEAPLSELPDELQDLFVRRWYAAVDPGDAQAKAEGLLVHLSEREDLVELRGNPMLLTALCVKYGEGQRLPQDFFKLYDALIEQVLYKRYETDKEREDARRRLAAIALGMHRGAAKHPRTTPAAEVTHEEVDDILASLVQTDVATERGASDVGALRDGLLSHSGLLLPRKERRAAFYHLSFQEFLAATRLRVMKESVTEALDRHAPTRAWHRTLGFLFCAMADRESPEAALDAFGGLEAGLEPAALSADPSRALLLAACLDIAHARGWNLDRFWPALPRACEHALTELDPPERNSLWLTLGRLGWDDRPGVGVRDGLPDINWISIPEGTFLFGEGRGKKRRLHAFRISRYPVTHAQFQCFVDDGGYEDETWWQGLDVRPQRWRARWTEPNVPRERVSWFEAVAFARWVTTRLQATGRLDREAVVRLPTEFEWERAARGTDGREFPWGEFNSGRANLEADVGRTSPVGIYPSGASPEGALDMAGNVWEWCLTDLEIPRIGSETGDVGRVVRGGSWGGGRGYARCAYRNRLHPGNRYGNLGFRLVCVSPIR